MISSISLKLLHKNRCIKRKPVISRILFQDNHLSNAFSYAASKLERKGTIAAKSNLHPAGVYLALIPYGIRRWALTPPLHNHLLMGYGLRNNQPSERRRIIAAHTFALALLIKCVALRFASLGRTGILLFCGTVLTLTRTWLSQAARLFGCPDFPHEKIRAIILRLSFLIIIQEN